MIIYHHLYALYGYFMFNYIHAMYQLSALKSLIISMFYILLKNFYHLKNQQAIKNRH